MQHHKPPVPPARHSHSWNYTSSQKALNNPSHIWVVVLTDGCIQTAASSESTDNIQHLQLCSCVPAVRPALADPTCTISLPAQCSGTFWTSNTPSAFNTSSIAHVALFDVIPGRQHQGPCDVYSAPTTNHLPACSQPLLSTPSLPVYSLAPKWQSTHQTSTTVTLQRCCHMQLNHYTHSAPMHCSTRVCRPARRCLS